MRRGMFTAACLGLALVSTAFGRSEGGTRPLTMADVLGATTASDWRTPELADLLYLDLEAGRVVIELAPAFAPAHVANIRKLARQKYWDGLAIVRVQENYVVQWGDPESGNADRARELGAAERQLPAEFTVAASAVAFTRLPDGDVYAPQVGWSNGFPVARESAADGDQAWLAHCYAAVGAGRENAADSSNGSELYVVTGHSPRHLDRNITLVGRVLTGMEVLGGLPRGRGPMGFFEDAAQRIAIRSIRLGSDVPEAERVPLQVMRTDTPAFERLVESRRNRREEWFVHPVGKVELCNVPVPVRQPPPED
jgi:peptidylprolyl isomerase